MDKGRRKSGGIKFIQMNLLMGLQISCIVEYILRLLISAIFGLILGYERRNNLQVIGMRTLILISVSTSLLGILSGFAIQGTSGDPSRITAGVVSGIGFLGGGAIMQRGLNVKGITTAAVIWSTAALGVAVGTGLYIPAFCAFLVIIISLPIFESVERKIFVGAKIKVIKLVFQSGSTDFEKIKSILNERKFVLRDICFSEEYTDKKVTISLNVNAPQDIDIIELSNAFSRTGTLLEFSYSEV